MERALGRPARRARRGDRLRPADASRLLFLLGRRVRRARRSGSSLAYAWAAFPFTLYALNTNANDALVAAARRSLRAARRGAAGRARGASAALAGADEVRAARARAAARDARPRRPAVREQRGGSRCSPSRSRSSRPSLLPLAGDDLAHVLRPHARLPGRRAARRSRSGACTTWTPLRTVVQAARCLLAARAGGRAAPARPAGLAALCAAVLIALQLGVTHWFYLYIVWFFPLVMLAAAWALPPAAARRLVLALAVVVCTTSGPTRRTSRSPTSSSTGRLRGPASQDGLVPYRDFAFEYPPLALVPIALGGVARHGEATYQVVFGAAHARAALLALQRVRRACSRGRARRCGVVAAVAAARSARWCARTSTSLPAAMRRRRARARSRAAATTWAFARARARHDDEALPGAARRRSPLRGCSAAASATGSLRGLAAFAAVVVAVVRCRSSATATSTQYRFHLDRPVQIESTPATVLSALGDSHVTGTAARPDEFKSNGLDGGPAGRGRGALHARCWPARSSPCASSPRARAATRAG